MNQILRSDWLPGPSGQDAAILSVRDCLLCSRKKNFSLKPAYYVSLLLLLFSTA